MKKIFKMSIQAKIFKTTEMAKLSTNHKSFHGATLYLNKNPLLLARLIP